MNESAYTTMNESAYLNPAESCDPHIAPFFHLGPESSLEALTEQLNRLNRLGIHEVTVEYGSGSMELTKFDEKFYQAVDNLVIACRECGAKFRLQDAAPFPTGGVNGLLADEKYAGYRKVYLDERHIDVSGPVNGAAFRIKDLLHVVNSSALTDPERMDVSDRRILSVQAVQMDERKHLVDGTSIVFKGQKCQNFLNFDVPRGYWRIFVFFTTGKSSGRRNYMNLLDKDSVRLEMENVHVPIYEHLKGELGKTWIGFFYDEPEIGNTGSSSAMDYHMLPGKRQNETENVDALPWSKEMPGKMSSLVPDWEKLLPYLFYDGQGAEAAARYQYMNAVTSLVRENYNRQVYSWCRERKIPYVGHVLEDENSHGRLGCGTGHFFRTEYYQDRAGVDLISAQVMPGADVGTTWYGSINGSGSFYHYGLAKLASSEARINPLKNGKSICEVYGVYGAMLGPKMRKFLADHLFVNGINEIVSGEVSTYGVPEAFYRVINSYTDRMCSLLERTRGIMKAAILYHADAEWCGETQTLDLPARQLARHQISYDIIPDDVFSMPEMYGTDITKGLRVNGNTYEVLVIPGCRYLPAGVSGFLRTAVRNRFPVLVVDEMPEKICGTEAAPDKEQRSALQAVPLEKLADRISALIDPDFCVLEEEDAEGKVHRDVSPWIRYEHCIGNDMEYFLMHNEAPQAEGTLAVRIVPENSSFQKLVLIDPATGMVEIPDQYAADQTFSRRRGICFRTRFSQYEMKVAVVGTAQALASFSRDNHRTTGTKRYLEHGWVFSAGEKNPEQPLQDLKESAKMVGREFSGRMNYTCRVFLDENEGMPVRMDLGKVFESCELTVNGVFAGYRVSPPYLYDVEGLFHPGENLIQISVWNNPANEQSGRKILGMNLNAVTAVPYMIVEPSGMTGPVSLQFSAVQPSEK